MIDPQSNSNSLYSYLLTNSLFTPRQLSIILKILQGGPRAENITSGAYYRQVKQCRKKVLSVLYSMILLQSIGIIHPETSTTLGRISEQLAVIFASEDNDVTSKLNVNHVMSVIDEMVKRMSKL
jgi:hypothetical protein